MDDHPFTMVLCKMHVIDAPGGNEFHAGCVIEHFIHDDLFWRIWWELAVFVIGLCMFKEFSKRHRAFCGFLVIHEETTLCQVGVNAPLYLRGVCLVDPFYIIEYGLLHSLLVCLRECLHICPLVVSVFCFVLSGGVL